MTEMDELKARVLDAVRSTPAPTRRQWRARTALLLGVGAALSLVVFFNEGGVRAAPRPGELVLATSLGAAVIAGVTLWSAFGRGRSMLGRSLAWRIGTAAAAPMILLAWKVHWSARYPSMMVEWSTRPGFRCLALGLTVGACLLGAMVLARRDGDPRHGVALGITLGTAAGAWAWVFVDLWCPVAYLPHLFLGHVLPILVLASVGAWLGASVLTVRPARVGVRREHSA